jgi:uncharacterized membrane protein
MRSTAARQNPRGMRSLFRFNKKALDKQAFIWWYEVFGLLFFAPVFFFTLVRQDVNVSISWTYIFLSGIVHFFYWYFLSSALKKGDLSFVYPIMRSSPALVLFFSITILKEGNRFSRTLFSIVIFIGCYFIAIAGG